MADAPIIAAMAQQTPIRIIGAGKSLVLVAASS